MAILPLVLDPDIETLGLSDAPEQLLLDALWADFTSSTILTGYFTGEMANVDAEDIAVQAGVKVPSFYFAYMGEEEEQTASGDAFRWTTWAVILTMPPRADAKSAGRLGRFQLVREVRRIVYADGRGGARELEDGTPLTAGMVRWQRIDAPRPAADNGSLVTIITFALRSRVNTATGDLA